MIQQKDSEVRKWKVEFFCLGSRLLESDRAIQSYIDSHKDVYEERFERTKRMEDLNSINVDASVAEICDECRDGKNIVSHNIGGLLNLIKRKPDFWKHYM